MASTKHLKKALRLYFELLKPRLKYILTKLEYIISIRYIYGMPIKSIALKENISYERVRQILFGVYNKCLIAEKALYRTYIYLDNELRKAV